MEFWIFLVSLEQQGLTFSLVLVADGLRREIFDGNQFLMGFHKGFKQTHEVNPIVTFPTRIAFQSVVEIEAVDVDYNILFYHIQKNKPTLPLAGSLSANLLEGDTVANIQQKIEIWTLKFIKNTLF